MTCSLNTVLLALTAIPNTLYLAQGSVLLLMAFSLLILLIHKSNSSKLIKHLSTVYGHNFMTIIPIPYDGRDDAVRNLNKVEHRQSNAIKTISQEEPNQEEQHNEEAYIFVKERNSLVKVYFKDITYFEGFGDYVKMHTVHRTYTLHLRLTEIEERLKNLDFMRIHRSYIIRLGKVDLIQNKKVIIKETEIPVSNSYWEALVEVIPKF